MSPLTPRERQELDRHITGNYGEDQFPEDAGEMTPEQEAAEAAAAEEEYQHFLALQLRSKIDGVVDALKDARMKVKDRKAFEESLLQAQELWDQLTEVIWGE